MSTEQADEGLVCKLPAGVVQVDDVMRTVPVLQFSHTSPAHLNPYVHFDRDHTS